MKRTTKSPVTVMLMASSIVLLLVLQFFWLQSSYNEAAENFRKETNALFRNTIFALHDSLIARNIEPLESDSMARVLKPKCFLFRDSINFEAGPGHGSDFTYIKIHESTARIDMSSSTAGKDSLGRVLRPLITRMQSGRKAKSFILRLGVDSLSADSIGVHYKRALDNAGIQASFEVRTVKDDRNGKIGKVTLRPKGIYTSEIVRLNPFSHYAVSFMNIDALLLREIAPEILFSFFLTLLTLASFYMMYRNTRAQQRLMQIKNDFISNVTHELKTPVATVSVALEALKNFRAIDDPKRTFEYLGIAQNELNRLTLMTDNILRTAVYEEEGADLKIERVNLDKLIAQVLASMKLVFEKHKTKWSYQSDGTDFALDGSHAHLTNVLYNLIDNALKYSADESSLTISLKTGGGKLILSVCDTGIGIAPEFQKKIFEKFFRVPSGDIHNTKGYGLGLNYVSSVVKSHKGQIAVESEVGKGSSFVITLPAALP